MRHDISLRSCKERKKVANMIVLKISMKESDVELAVYAMTLRLLLLVPGLVHACMGLVRTQANSAQLTRLEANNSLSSGTKSKQRYVTSSCRDTWKWVNTGNSCYNSSLTSDVGISQLHDLGSI